MLICAPLKSQGVKFFCGMCIIIYLFFYLFACPYVSSLVEVSCMSGAALPVWHLVLGRPRYRKKVAMPTDHSCIGTCVGKSYQVSLGTYCASNKVYKWNFSVGNKKNMLFIT